MRRDARGIDYQTTTKEHVLDDGLMTFARRGRAMGDAMRDAMGVLACAHARARVVWRMSSKTRARGRERRRDEERGRSRARAKDGLRAAGDDHRAVLVTETTTRTRT